MQLSIAPAVGCLAHLENRPRRWRSNCALLLSAFYLQMSFMIPGVEDMREAKMTWGCSPWNRSRVAIAKGSW